MVYKRGITREVLLVGNLVFKFPSMRSWYLFLEGLQSNMNESYRSKYSDGFCPTFTVLPGGFLNVQPRCLPTTLSIEEYEDFLLRHPMHSCVEYKDCSFGIFNEKKVAVDYG